MDREELIKALAELTKELEVMAAQYASLHDQWNDQWNLQGESDD